MFKTKRAWIKIVEATIALLLIAGVVLVMIGQGHIKKEDISPEIYKTQTAILR